jgi:hypothetical protein
LVQFDDEFATYDEDSLRRGTVGSHAYSMALGVPSRSFSLIMGDVILRDFDGNTLSSAHRMGLDFDVILLTPSTYPRLLAIRPH